MYLKMRFNSLKNSLYNSIVHFVELKYAQLN